MASYPFPRAPNEQEYAPRTRESQAPDPNYSTGGNPPLVPPWPQNSHRSPPEVCPLRRNTIAAGCS